MNNREINSTPFQTPKQTMNVKIFRVTVILVVIGLLMIFHGQEVDAQGRLNGSSEQKFRAQVEKLKDMGFKNGNKNKPLINLVYALVSTKGNVYKAMQQFHF